MRTKSAAAAVLQLLVAAAICGCVDHASKYTPSAAAAEAALRCALDAWKAGQPVGPVPDTKPVIHVTDGGRKTGQTLERYEVLGETRGTAGRTFVVQLHLANPEERLKARYVLVGIDPLWVFRQEDYELLMHWDHHMPAEEVPATAGR